MSDQKTEYEISPATYEWTARLFTLLRKVLAVNFKLHHGEAQIADGDIFLFNHFARFETFIPQYLIYLESGAYCRSIAGREFFVDGDPFSNYLTRVGAVPDDLPDLLPFLAKEILRGRKVMVFPEGGMVKDKRVLDPRGSYSVYSRTAEVRRKQHTGAAVLGLALEAFKRAVLAAYEAGHSRRIDSWAESLELESGQKLLDAARRPTHIVPANITFYPIRVSDNLLRQGAELLSRGLSRRLSEELLIEGNILLRDTDMDIRLCKPVRVSNCWHWWERRLLERVAPRLGSLGEAFALRPDAGRWDRRLLARRLRRNAMRLRDDYMHRMYMGVTVNLSHLASSLVLGLVDRKYDVIEESRFHRMLYVAVKRLQSEAEVHLHRSLRNPQNYGGLLDDECTGLEQFLGNASRTDLIYRDGGEYRFQPKLRAEHAFDEIRLENLVEVYANEAAPIRGVGYAIREALDGADLLTGETLVRLRFDDELIAYEWDRQQFSKPRHREINDAETATESGEPFLLMPPNPRPLGVVLVHGFLASPAEMREFGEQLFELGFPVLGVRLKGHGTSPWDLRERGWQDWQDSVRRGFSIMAELAPRTALVGFSTGGALSLILAAERPARLAGVVAASVPMKFQDRGMRFVPLVHGANRLVRWVSSFEGIKPFQSNESEHPHINYRQMPVRGLYELTVLVDALKASLPQVACPVKLVQGSDDPVVVADSVNSILEHLGDTVVELKMIDSQRHGIINENIGDTRTTIVASLDAWADPGGGPGNSNQSLS
ncbi:MAG: alpha/beta fold hydrolase [Proteobacteria bacterium]|jgi:esterase/lipase|nr:alpha/beta fold hydrolase [Pseudomonadota bacterium]